MECKIFQCFIIQRIKYNKFYLESVIIYKLIKIILKYWIWI